jgi:hypothetical protein
MKSRSQTLGRFGKGNFILNKMLKICPICSIEFYVKPSQFIRRVCCSKNCNSINQKNKIGVLNNNWKGGIKSKVCKNCNKEFISSNPYNKTIFCSHKCSSDFSIGRKVTLHENTLKYIENKKIAGQNNPNKKCNCGNKKDIKSKKCWACFVKKIKRKEKIGICENCKNSFIMTYFYGNKYCSKKCKKDHLQIRYLSENNPNWRGGVKSQNQIGRFSVKYVEWRNSVFKRDQYTCQKCGQIGKSLHSHHILPWAKNYKHRYDLINGITLCVKCHKEVHSSNDNNFIVRDFEQFMELYDNAI